IDWRCQRDKFGDATMPTTRANVAPGSWGLSEMHTPDRAQVERRGRQTARAWLGLLIESRQRLPARRLSWSSPQVSLLGWCPDFLAQAQPRAPLCLRP